MKIRRIRGGQFTKEFEESPGYRHVVTSTDLSKAIDFPEEQSSKICDLDFFGNPYQESGYNKCNRKPEFERWKV